MKRTLGAAEIATLLLGAVPAALFAYVVVMRFVNPADAEWMTATVRESVERVRDGKSLYGPPSETFIPYLYPPIYFWLSAALAHVLPTLAACKTVSVLATAATTWGTAQIARRLGASTFWSVIAGLLHIGVYSQTLFFYDLERVDACETALVAVGLVVLLGRSADQGKREGTWRSLIAGLILGLAFFAKQPGFLPFLAVVVGLILGRQRRRALLVLGSGGLAFTVLYTYLQISTHGWFHYYVLKLPGSHGIQASLLTVFWCIDVPHVFALGIGTLAILLPVAGALLHGAKRRALPDMPWRDLAFAAVLAAGLVGAFSLRAHLGGWANVIVAWTPLGCAAAALAASRAQGLAEGTSAGGAVRFLLLATVGIQFVGGFFDPFENSTQPADVREQNKLIAYVRRLEKDGEVVVTTKGQISAVPHFNAAALYDVIRAGDPAPAELLAKIKEGKYAAIVSGGPSEFQCDVRACADLTDVLRRYYFVATRLNDAPRTGMTGFDARPRWVLRPRKHPLLDATMKELERRQRNEVGLSALRALSAEPDSDTEPDEGKDIEDLAERNP